MIARHTRVQAKDNQCADEASGDLSSADGRRDADDYVGSLRDDERTSAVAHFPCDPIVITGSRTRFMIVKSRLSLALLLLVPLISNCSTFQQMPKLLAVCLSRETSNQLQIGLENVIDALPLIELSYALTR